MHRERMELAPFVLAHHRVYGNVDHALALLAGLVSHLDEGCIGSISENMQSSAQRPGCFAQAWSVSETLRAFHALTAGRTSAKATHVVGV